MPSSLPFPSAASPGFHDRRESQTISSPQMQSSSNSKQRINQNAKYKKTTIRHRLLRLCKEGRPQEACRLFDSIPNPSTVLWNTIIIGFICNDLPDDALLFYARMNASPGTQCDSYTYSSVLKACAAARRLRAGKAVHCHVLRCQLIPNRVVYNSLLNMYSNCLSGAENSTYRAESKFPQRDLVRKVFDKMTKKNVVSWNILVSWYVKKGRFVEAIKLLKRMLDSGVKPTVISFVSVFPAISSIQDLFNATVLYGMLLKLGNQYLNNLFSVSSAICMFAELGCVDFAQIIFDHCPERNTGVWNAISSGYIQNDLPVEAIHLLLQALESELIVIDDITLVLALSAVSQLQQLEFGQQLHAYAIKFPMSLDVSVLNAIIVMYSRCGSVEMAFRAFEKMVERDVFSWNTMVSALVQNGLDFEGLQLVYEMQKQGMTIDSITGAAILSAASNLQNPETGKQTHAYLLRHGIEIVGITSYLVDMYAKCCLLKSANRIFQSSDDSDRDPATWNAMIAGYTQNGLVEEAFVALRLMLENNQTPNPVSLASILPACNPMGYISFGKQLHAFAIRHAMDQNAFVSTALVDVYSKTGAITYAEKVFNGALERNSVTFTAMITGYSQHGMGKEAVSLFRSLHDHSIEPDAVTFVGVLTACSYAGLVEEGLRVFELMEREYQIQPTIEHYSCVADMLGRAGRVLEAYEFVKGLHEKGNARGIWVSVLGACRLHKKHELGKIVSDKLLEMETMDVSSVDEMLEKDLRKEAGQSSIELASMVNTFVSRDQRHQQCHQIYEMLGELSMEMKNDGYFIE